MAPDLPRCRSGIEKWTIVGLWVGVVGCGAVSMEDETSYSASDQPVQLNQLMLDVGAAGRPSSVPNDFVATPFGYFHPSCIAEAAPGEVVLDSGLVRRPDGSYRAVPPCLFPRYDRSGIAIYPESSPPPAVNGWNAFVKRRETALQRVSAEWFVPQANYVNTIYLFPGLQDVPTTRILQPVLGWNGADAGGGWVIYSWNCCVNDGTAWHSAPIGVTLGQHVRGDVEGTNCNASTGLCSNWRITTEKETSPGQWLGTTLDTTVSTAMRDVFGGVLEIYNATQCENFPATNSLTFSAIAAQLVTGGGLTGPWTNTEIQSSPDCITDVSSTATTATIGIACQPSSSLCYAGDTTRCGIFAGDGCGGTIECICGDCHVCVDTYCYWSCG
jgi:hypothetical protein